MTESNLFELVQLIKSAAGDPSAMTDAIWEAGYRQPERTARAQLHVRQADAAVDAADDDAFLAPVELERLAPLEVQGHIR